MKLVGYCCEDEHRVLIYEFMPRGSVESKLFSSNLSRLHLLVVAVISALKSINIFWNGLKCIYCETTMIFQLELCDSFCCC